jgi:hypothetical protein
MNIVKGKMSGTEYDESLPSGRILYALEAMKYFEATDGLDVDMSRYRAIDLITSTCFACCGGAARSVKEGWTTPDTFTVAARSNHYEISLDRAQSGDIGRMFAYMGLSDHDGDRFNRNIKPYVKNNTESFYLGMKELASDLEEEGF